MAKKNYYLILGVPRTATPESIRRAFRRLAKDHHPDRTGAETSQEFHDLVEAYEVLSDPGKRKRYNHSLRPRLTKTQARTTARSRPRPFTPELLRPEPLRSGRRSDPEPEPLIPERRRTSTASTIDFQQLLEHLLRRRFRF